MWRSVMVMAGILSLTANTVISGSEINVDDDISRVESQIENIGSVLEYKLEEVRGSLESVDSRFDSTEGWSISSVKILADFAEGYYILAECSPSGYFIYDPESGNVVESSLTAPSPYLNKDFDLYYCGPNEYYMQTDFNEYTYTITQETISATEMDGFDEYSVKMKEELASQPDSIALSIASGSIEQNLDEYSVELTSLASEGWALVKNYSFFTNLASCGYCEVNAKGNKVSSGGNGICGYIAAGMLLTYDTVKNEKEYISSLYYTKNGDTVSIKSALPYMLYKKGEALGYGTETTSVEIHYALKSFFNVRNISVNHVSYYAPIANNAKVANYLYDDRPVIYFGRISNNTYDNQKNINHAVVIYGYKMSILGQYSYIAHFGWEGANTVSFSGIIGSMYTYTY